MFNNSNQVTFFFFHDRYKQMTTFVKLVLRYIIFSSHERKFLVGITKPAAIRSWSALQALVCGSGGGLEVAGIY